MIIFVALKKILLLSAQLPEPDYFEASFLLGLSKSSLLFLFVIAGYCGFLLKQGHIHRIWVSWQSFQHGKILKYFILFLSGILTWQFSTYDFNYYYNQGHFAERILLLLLLIGIAWRPVFTLPFLLLLIAIASQFNYPLGIGFSRPTDNLLIQVVTLFFAWLIIFTLKEKKIIEPYIFLTCCLIAGHYWYPGWGKLGLNWFTNGDIYLIMLNAYAHGWLSFLSTETIVNIAKHIADFDILLVLGTLIIEVGAVFFLWKKWTLKLFIIAWLSFHSLVFFMTGYLFWKWALLELALWFSFFRNKTKPEINIFSKPYFALSVALIVFVSLWYMPPKLCWYDTNLSYTYVFEAVTKDSTIYKVPARFFAPYDDLFTFGNFSYLTPMHQLVGPYGASQNMKTVRELQNATSAEAVFNIEKQYPLKNKSKAKLAGFDQFIKRFFKHLNRDISQKKLFSSIQPPPTFWSFTQGNKFNGEEKVDHILVRQITTLYDGLVLKIIRNKVVRNIVL